MADKKDVKHETEKKERRKSAEQETASAPAFAVVEKKQVKKKRKRSEEESVEAPASVAADEKQVKKGVEKKKKKKKVREAEEGSVEAPTSVAADEKQAKKGVERKKKKAREAEEESTEVPEPVAKKRKTGGGLGKALTKMARQVQDALKGFDKKLDRKFNDFAEEQKRLVDDIKKKQMEQLEAMEELKQSARFSAQLADKLEFSEGVATHKRDPTFRQRVAGYYGSEVKLRVPKVQASGKVKNAVRSRYRCAATGALLPPEDVVAGHLFKFAWENQKHLLNLENIDDPRNGLILCKAVESAYDNSQLTFVRKGGHLVMHLLDPELAGVNVLQRTKEPVGEAFREPDSEATQQRYPEHFSAQPDIQNLTFGDLDGQPLVLPPHKQPFNRCLCFHANQARKRAVKLKWLSSIDDFDFNSFWTEGESYVDKVRAWMATSKF